VTATKAADNNYNTASSAQATVALSKTTSTTTDATTLKNQVDRELLAFFKA
jgi:hypothetical protein